MRCVSGSGRMIEITMQPQGPAYVVEVTGVMIASSAEDINRSSKIRPEQPVATLKESVMMCKNKSSKQNDTTSPHQSSKGRV